MSQAKAFQFMHSIAPRCRNALATATWYRRALKKCCPWSHWSNCPLPSMSGGGEEHRVYVEASQAQPRDSAHGRSSPWRGRNSQTDHTRPTPWNHCPCRVGQDLQDTCSCLSIYSREVIELFILCFVALFCIGHCCSPGCMEACRVPG